jgi:hypothetical protein
MFAAGAEAFGAAVEIALFPQPPHRSSRPERRSQERARNRPSLIGSIRQALSALTAGGTNSWLPR